MLHSLFVPHIVATMPQNWLGLGHAAFVQKSFGQFWGAHRFLRQLARFASVSDFGGRNQKLPATKVSWAGMIPPPMVERIIGNVSTTKLGLTMCFLRQCCTHSLCPTLWPLCPKTGSVLAMQPLCRSHGWTVVNHYGHTKLGVSPCFFAAMLHSLFVPHIVATVPQNWLGLGHAAFVQKS